ncbi:MAG TPA: type II secretion system protein GspM [Stellaceae bacterium]|nr:type II secretion system protein GspM [Stellaceae bacterium]
MSPPALLAQASPTMRRVVALGLLAALLCLAGFWVVLPLWQSYADATASADELDSALAKLEAAGRNPAALEAELAKLKTQRAAAPGLLAGPTDALASAQLQSRLNRATEAARGVFRSAQPLPMRDEGPYRRVGVRVLMTVKLAELVRIFHDLESASPFLFLDQVSVKTAMPFRVGKAAQTEEQEPSLDVEFELYGYVRKPAGPAA